VYHTRNQFITEEHTLTQQDRQKRQAESVLPRLAADLSAEQEGSDGQEQYQASNRRASQ
jgi:hypothetical protein